MTIDLNAALIELILPEGFLDHFIKDQVQKDVLEIAEKDLKPLLYNLFLTLSILIL